MNKLENKIIYYKETFECQNLIFWPWIQSGVHCHTQKLDPNQEGFNPPGSLINAIWGAQSGESLRVSSQDCEGMLQHLPQIQVEPLLSLPECVCGFPLL
jgi:hypothetical protein